MFEKLKPRLQEMAEKFDALLKQAEDPEIYSTPRFPALQREIGGMRQAVTLYREVLSLEKQIADLDELAGDPEMAEMAEAERPQLQQARDDKIAALVGEFVMADEDSNRNAIVEIRAGAGGDEAGIFAGDLFRMYSYFAEKRAWKIEIMEISEAEHGGYKQITFQVAGQNVFQQLKYESGTHRVQRVPKTEAQGRIHTSTATVAVLPEAEEVDVEIKKEDYDLDTYRAGGKGGQHVNKTESAVRLTHRESGLVVTCQDERSQGKNLQRALTVLRSRLYALRQEKLANERADMRRSQIGGGTRSEKVRTYNYPQDRVTDHRIGQNFALHVVVEGELEKIIEALQEFDKQERLAAI